MATPLEAISTPLLYDQPSGTRTATDAAETDGAGGGTFEAGRGSQGGTATVAETSCSFAASYVRGPGRRLLGLYKSVQLALSRTSTLPSGATPVTTMICVPAAAQGYGFASPSARSCTDASVTAIITG